MKAEDVVPNEFLTEPLGTNWIAVDANGTPVCRADNKASVERAMPDAAGYFTGSDFVSAVTAAPEAPAAVPAPARSNITPIAPSPSTSAPEQIVPPADTPKPPAAA